MHEIERSIFVFFNSAERTEQEQAEMATGARIVGQPINYDTYHTDGYIGDTIYR